jgi:hypothetical protein
VDSRHQMLQLQKQQVEKEMTRELKTMSADKLEVCWRCGKPCNLELYVFSKRKQKNLPLCKKCAEVWLEHGRMPR